MSACVPLARGEPYCIWEGDHSPQIYMIAPQNYVKGGRDTCRTGEFEKNLVHEI